MKFLKGESVCANRIRDANMKNHWMKVLALMLSLMMLFSVVACASTGDGEDTTAVAETTEADNGENTEAGDQTTAEGNVTEEDTAMHDVPSDLKLNKEISILRWSDVEMAEFDVEDITGDTVGDEIYWRNKYTEDTLGITLKWYSSPGNWENRNNFSNFVQASYEASDRIYDIIASYSCTMGIMSTKGYLADLNSINGSYINYDEPWWPAGLVETATIDDSVYFISGDISTNTLYFMYGVFCNVNMINNLNLEDPMVLVQNMEWTLGKFIEMASGVYADTDADGKASTGDTYGFTTHKLHIDQFYVGSDLSLLEKDEEDILVLSPDFYSERVYNVIDLLTPFVNGPDTCKSDNETIFVEERALFANNRLYFADRKLKDVSFVYTILPTPMYDVEQNAYYTCVGNPMTLWGIMSDAKEEEKTEFSAVMEVMAYYAYKHTSPAIFEVNYKSKYSETDEASKMFDVIRAGVRHDLGRILNTDLVGCTMTQEFAGAIWNQESWASIIGTWKRTITKKLEKVVDSYLELKS